MLNWQKGTCLGMDSLEKKWREAINGPEAEGVPLKSVVTWHLADLSQECLDLAHLNVIIDSLCSCYR